MPKAEHILATTCFSLEGFSIVRYRGVVCGSAVRTPTIAESIFGRLKHMLGGRITSFAHMSDSSHSEAYQDMLRRAKALGANAVIRVRYETAMIVPKLSASEVVCYGTAIIAKRIEQNTENSSPPEPRKISNS